MFKCVFKNPCCRLLWHKKFNYERTVLDWNQLIIYDDNIYQAYLLHDIFYTHLRSRHNRRKCNEISGPMIVFHILEQHNGSLPKTPKGNPQAHIIFCFKLLGDGCLCAVKGARFWPHCRFPLPVVYNPRGKCLSISDREIYSREVLSYLQTHYSNMIAETLPSQSI